jgi:hypothetical protein
VNRRQPTAVDLDDLLAALTLEMAAAIRQHAPAGFSDQLHAAHRDSVALVQTAEKNANLKYLPASGVDD